MPEVHSQPVSSIKPKYLTVVEGIALATDGQTLRSINRRARVMFQDACLFPWKRIETNVRLGLQRDRHHAAANALMRAGERTWPAAPRCVPWGSGRGDLRTAKGYALTENLRRCWHHRLEKTERQHFLSWIRWARRSTLAPFAKVASVIESKIDNIVSYFRHRISNGPQEGMNAKLMSIIRSARGYRSEETSRMAALFFMGRLDMSLRWRHE